MVPLVDQLTEVGRILKDLRDLAIDLYTPTDRERRGVAIELNAFADHLATLSEEGLGALEERLAPVGDDEDVAVPGSTAWQERTESFARDLVELGDRVLSLSLEEDRFLPNSGALAERIHALGRQLADLGARVSVTSGIPLARIARPPLVPSEESSGPAPKAAGMTSHR
jgi:hypothetical protein